MYTRCSECQTLFRVSREQLNAARGQVRCGRCGNVFDALTSLQEELLLDEQPERFVPEEPEEPEQPVQPFFVLEEEEDSAQEQASLALHRQRSHEETEERSQTEAVEEEVVAEEQPRAPMLAPRRPNSRRWPWVVAGIVLALALLAQATHLYRDTLVEHELVGPYVSMAYEAIGRPVARVVPVDLDAFALLHHELVTHPNDARALHLSGVLSNGADFAQPWPVLELRLENRFGEVVASRRLQPDEYLRNPPTGNEPMPARARRAIEVGFADPGHEAVGFSIDFCVQRDDGLRCAAQTGG